MDDFGGKLRQARERRGISLRQIAASTKISAAALEALERNDISKLPGGIFSRAFVRSYASEVGLDPDETVREFLERFHQEPAPSADNLAVVPIPEEERAYQELQRKAARVLGIAVVAIPVLAILLYFGLRGRSKSQARVETPQSAPDVSTSAPQPAPPPPPSQPAPSLATPPAADAGAPSAAAPSHTRAMKLDVHPTSDCWISLTIDGQTLFARIMKAGEHESH